MIRRPRFPFLPLLLALAAALATGCPRDGRDAPAPGPDATLATETPDDGRGGDLTAKDPRGGDDGRLDLTGAPPVEIVIDELAIFESETEYEQLLADHGIEPPEPGLVLTGSTSPPPGADDWLDVPVPQGALLGVAPNQGGGLGTGGTTAPADDFASGGGGGGGTGPVGGSEVLVGSGSGQARWAIADGLPLRDQPATHGAVLMELDHNDRVFVHDGLPVIAGNQVFVEVQVADRSPFPVGWFPLHWLAVGATTESEDTLRFRARYGLFGRLLADLFRDTFYASCTSYPSLPHHAWENTPSLVDPASIPYAERYECGELPVGEVVSGDWKLVTTRDFDVPGMDYGVLVADPMTFQVPVQHSRLGAQKRRSYGVKDMDTGWSGSDGNADLVTHETYRASTQDALLDAAVRLHDSDVWYNVTWTPPAGVSQPGADAFVNVCFELPGGRLRGAETDEDITLSGPLSSSHIDGIDWGTFEYDPFRLCATAALHDEPGDPTDDLATGPQPAIRVRFVRASIQDLVLRLVAPVTVHGDFSLPHGLLKDTIQATLSGLLASDGVTGFLFERYLQDGLEARVVSTLNEMTSRLGSRMPDPKGWIADSCDDLIGHYGTPASRFYPLYQHCQQAKEAATVATFTNEPTIGSSCYAHGEYARASTGKLFHDDGDDEHWYMPDRGDGPVLSKIDRPYWVSGCGVAADATTTTMEGYWPVLECLADTYEDSVNYEWDASKTQDELEEACTTPAVYMLCQLYGEGDDLLDAWEARWGVRPPAAGIFGFCAWYDQLTAEDGPDLTTGG